MVEPHLQRSRANCAQREAATHSANQLNGATASVVILQSQVSDQAFTHQVAQCVLEFHRLDKEIVLRIQAGHSHRRLEEEAEPLLNAQAAQLRATLRQIEEQNEVEHNRRGKDGVAAEEINLNLHGIAEPSEDVDVVPAFFVVATRRVVVDTDFVEDIAVEFGIESGLKNVLEHAELGLLLGLKGTWIVEHFAVAVAEDVG